VPRILSLLLVVTGVAVAACAPSAPQVTFSANGKSITAAAARYCDPTGQNCTPPPKNPVAMLAIPPHAPLQISVPKQVSQAPWQVAFLYRGLHGEDLQGRTPVFPPNQQHDYTLQVPADGTRLEHVEIQEFSGVVSPNTQGGVDFSIGGSWLLDVQ
jgi:hypothetical protein